MKKQFSKTYKQIRNLRSILFLVIRVWDNLFNVSKDSLNILAYHGISESGDLYSVNPSSFRSQINIIQNRSKFVSLDEVLKVIGGKKIKGSNVILTFDDGYENVLAVAPYLKEKNIPAALFVLSDTLNVDRKEIGNSRKFLSINQIKYLSKQGWIIGCHSATHRNFNGLSKKQIEEEIVRSKETLQNRLGFQIEYFAFPKGNFDQDILEAVKRAGYKAAFTTAPGSVKKGISKFIIPRTVINKSYQMVDFPVMISPTTYLLRTTFKGILDRFYMEK